MSVENQRSRGAERFSGTLDRVRPVLSRARIVLRPGFVAGALTVALALGALLLAYSQFQDLFRIVSPDGVVLDAPRAVRDGIDQHGWALVVLALAAAAGGVLAWATRLPLPAWGAVAIVVIALVITLAFDLPDATSAGLTGSGKELGEAEPAVGLWLQLASLLAMLFAGGALVAVLTRNRRS